MPEGDASRSVDWYQLRLYVEAGDVEAFTAVVKAHLLHRSTHFKILQRGLQTYCFTQVDSSKALAFACACIMRLLRQSQAQAAGTEGSALALCHLLLELVPCIVKQDAGVLPRVRPAAVDVLKSCWTPGLARLSVKVVQSFGIQAADVGNDKLLLAQIRQLLDDPNTYTPAVGLLMHFQELAAHVDCAAILGKLVAEAQTPLAEKWAAQLPRPLQVAFIEHCLAFDRLKEASKAVRHLGLQQEFPDVEQMYRQRSLARLVDKGLWSVAATFVGEDEAYQEQLVKSMLLAGEVALAEEYRQQFDLDPDVIRIDAAQLAAQDDLLAQTYLQLPLPPGAVHFVDDEAGIARAADALREVDAVGLDVEWQPNHVAGQTSSPASLLQVASRTHVFVIDLIRLHNSPALDACLAGLLQSEGVLKLGCALAGDLKKVAASYPHLGAFQSATRMLDLTGPWRLYMAATDRQTMVSRRSTVSIGLSAMAQSVLGKPLNKSMQVSDWEKRPLTAKQLAYAALDAHVLVQLYDAMTSGSAGLTRQQLLGSVFDFKALREPAGTAHKRARDSDAEEAQPDSLAASDETTTALDSARLPSPGPARTVAEASQSAASPAAQTIDQ
ncbi:hypothetical protein WJX72_003549 [[Myrmecia] bisecta]|uniref:3'-5' exonuclease domain-containing protein n=1 Tax=[Myrmecia] bisecta TaxID=41462 RepID=A0AAW1R4Y1_9CHLO